MTLKATAILLMGSLAIAGSPAMAATEAAVPTVATVDTQMNLEGVDLVCTGIGSDIRSDPRWMGYNVRVEFSNALNEYLVAGIVAVRDAQGRTLLNVSCDAPWVLLRLPPNSYVIEGRLSASAAKPRSARVVPPQSGQIRVVLQFPDG